MKENRFRVNIDGYNLLIEDIKDTNQAISCIISLAVKFPDWNDPRLKNYAEYSDCVGSIGVFESYYNFSAATQGFIYYHEAGHILCDDGMPLEQKTYEENPMPFEFVADEYAASKVGYDAAINALYELRLFVMNHIDVYVTSNKDYTISRIDDRIYNLQNKFAVLAA